jgi:hypothetical protein
VRFVGSPAGLGPLDSPCTNVVWFDLVFGTFPCPPDILAAEPTGQEVQAPSAPTTAPSAQILREPRIASYSREAVGLVVGVFCLLAILFVILLWWAGRLERASYLGTLYRDTVEDLEYRRLIAPLSEKFSMYQILIWAIMLKNFPISCLHGR